MRRNLLFDHGRAHDGQRNGAGRISDADACPRGIYRYDRISAHHAEYSVRGDFAGLCCTFVLALVLIRRSTRVLVTTAAVLLAVSPPLMILGGSVLSGANLLGDIAGGPMSALALAPAFVAGMAIGRFDLTRMRTALSLVSSGAVMLIVSKLLGVFVLPWLSRSFEEWLVSVQGTAGAEPDQYAIWPHNVAPPLWHNLLSIAPHSASTFQTMLGLGAAFWF